MTKRKMQTYYVLDTETDRVKVTEASSPIDALEKCYDSNGYDPEEQFVVFEAKNARTFQAIPSTFKEVK
jgi:hypothetical protein